jgi:hypothetical protein
MSSLDFQLRQGLKNIIDICLYHPEKFALAEQHQPGLLDSATEYQYSGQDDETDGPDPNGSDGDQVPS